MEHETKQFFQTLFPAFFGDTGRDHRYIELRSLGEGDAHKVFYPRTGCWYGMTQFLLRESQRDLFFGVHLRDREEGTASAITQAACLFVDIDHKESADWRPALRKLDAYRPLPSIVVKTGGGVHAYWLLNPPLPLTSAEERKVYSQYQKRLALTIGSDPVVCDPPRILRVPGTKNYKYDPPREVRLLTLTDTRHTIATLEGGMKTLPKPEPTKYRHSHWDSGDLSKFYRDAERPFPEGERCSRLCKWAVALRDGEKLPQAVIRDLIQRRANISAGSHPVTEKEIERICKWARVA